MKTGMSLMSAKTKEKSEDVISKLDKNEQEMTEF